MAWIPDGARRRELFYCDIANLLFQQVLECFLRDGEGELAVGNGESGSAEQPAVAGVAFHGDGRGGDGKVKRHCLLFLEGCWNQLEVVVWKSLKQVGTLGMEELIGRTVVAV